jgi:hypothetical protein
MDTDTGASAIRIPGITIQREGSDGSNNENIKNNYDFAICIVVILGSCKQG